MNNSSIKNSTSVGVEDVKEIIRSLSDVNNELNKDELKEAITKKLIDLFNEGKIISEDAQKYLQNFEEVYGKENNEIVEDTTESLITKLEERLGDKKFKNSGWENQKEYLYAICYNENNNIFTKWREEDRVTFLKKVIDYMDHPKKLGITLGEELTEGGTYNKNSISYFSNKDFEKENLVDKEQEITKMIENFIDREYNRDRPELAFLPFILDMSGGCYNSDGEFINDEDFHLRISDHINL
jgi:molybdopterin converting factor small subunit